MSPRFRLQIIALSSFLVLAFAVGDAITERNGISPLSGTRTNSQPSHDLNAGCDCYSFPKCLTNCSHIPGLVTQLQASRGFLEGLTTPFGITKPQQLRKRRFKYDTSTANKLSYFKHSQFRLNLLGNEAPIQAKVSKSSVFSTDGKYSTLFYRLRNGVVSEVESSELEDCFYTGEIDSTVNSSSYVAVDTCSGLRGAIYFQNTTFVILPLPCPSCEPQTAPHVVLPWRSPSSIRHPSTQRTFFKPVDLMAMPPPNPLLAINAPHTLWLEFIVDEDVVKRFGGNFTTALRYVASVVNLANLHFRELPIQIHLLRTQLWNIGNRTPIEKSIKATLNGIQRYLADQGAFGIQADDSAIHRSRREGENLEEDAATTLKHSSSLKSDVTVFLASSEVNKFDEDIDYMAIPGSICTPRATAVLRVNSQDFELRAASLLSKSIADILGIRSFLCPEMYSCDESQVFSLGDLSRIRLALLSGMSACLRSTSVTERESLRKDTCGNGVVDRGEECDPHQEGISMILQQGGGNLSSTTTTTAAAGCCDPRTCLADVKAVCVDGACCRGCQLVARGRLCRPARDQCDFAEFCSGSEADCPPDLHLENGLPCKVGSERSSHAERHEQGGVEEEETEETEERENALCYEGRCPTRSSHCRALWGPKARTADDYCYTTMNKNIDSACGEGVNCEDANTKCGLLHCREGFDAPVPLHARSTRFFNIRTQQDQQKIQCQYVASTQKFSYVPEGASCGLDHFCFHRRCIKPMAIAIHSKCPRGLYRPPSEGSPEDYIHPAVRSSLPSIRANITCSGRGICTNGAFCLCPPGWQGPSCSQRRRRQTPSSTSSKDPSPVKSHSKSPLSVEYPDEDITELIWMYLQAVDKSPEGFVEPSPVNTIYLISVLAAVICCVFFCLSGFIFLYRRRNIDRRDFHIGRKNAAALSSGGSRRSPPLDALLESPSVMENGGDSMCLCNRNSRPVGTFSDDMELQYRSRRSARSRRHRHISSKSGGKRRGRRRGGGGASSGDSLQADTNCGTESGPELGSANGRGDDSIRDEIGSGKRPSYTERMIKFGSMPSYREDKIKCARDKSTASTTPAMASSSDNAAIVVTASSTQASSNRYTAAPSPTTDFTQASQSVVWPPPPFLPVSCNANSLPLFASTGTALVLSTSSAGGGGGGGSPVVPWCSPVLSTTGGNRSGDLTAPPASTGDASVVTTSSHFRKAMTSSTISAEEVEPAQVSVVRDSNWRQPEKGILKNKHEGIGEAVKLEKLPTNGGFPKKPKHHRCSSPDSDSGSYTSGSSSTSTSVSSLSTHSSCSTSRATDDTNSTSFSVVNVNAGGRVGGEVSDSESTCSTALDTAEDERKPDSRRCHHKHCRNRRHCKKHGHHHHHHHHHNKHRRRRCPPQQNSDGVESLSTATTTSTPTTTTASTNNSTPETSSGSSPCHRRCHRRRRISRRYRLANSTSDDAESSAGYGGAENFKVPTILCNAGQQTDEVSLLRAAGALYNDSPNGPKRPLPSPLKEDKEEMLEESDWEEVECTGGSDCEECQRNAVSKWVPSPAPASPSRGPLDAVPPTPPSSGGLLSRQYKLPSPPPPLSALSVTGYYCTTQLPSQQDSDPYYQPPLEDADSLMSDKDIGVPFMSKFKYMNHSEEDDGLISAGEPRGLQPTTMAMPANDCYMRDSDGLTRKNASGLPLIAKHNYSESDSDFSLSTKKAIPLTDWYPGANRSQEGDPRQHPTAANHRHQWSELVESDASSLPDASCDLVHLAQLSNAVKLNPNLSDLARQQAQIRLGGDQQPAMDTFHPFHPPTRP